MNEDIIEYLENKYKDLKWELSVTMDSTVKEAVEKDLNDCYETLKYFKTLTSEKAEDQFTPWKPSY
jgi:hypothetical protein